MDLIKRRQHCAKSAFLFSKDSSGHMFALCVYSPLQFFALALYLMIMHSTFSFDPLFSFFHRARQYSESRISTFFFISRLKPDKNRFQNNLKCQMVAKWVTFGNLAKKFEILAQYGLEAGFCFEIWRSLNPLLSEALLLIVMFLF